MPIVITDERDDWDLTIVRFRALDGASVEAGLHDPEQALKGALNELGTKDMASRPWASIAADTNQERIFSVAAGALADVGETGARDALEEIGEFIVEAERQVITNNNVGGPPLKKSTVERKGHSKKLVDTGEMLDSLSAEVFVQ